MKKLMGFIFAGVTLFALSGCGGGDTYYVEEVVPPDNLTTLFLVDQDGYSYAGIPYICDSMVNWSQTAPNGEFSFYPGENCEFDFDGLYGNYANDPLVDDIVYIVDYLDYGKGGIPYECASFGVGSFDYDIDDECIFYL